MKVAVTGASGFIGRHVLNALLAQHVSVVTTTRDKNRLAEFSDRVQIVELDLAGNEQGVFERLGKPDILMHLAWAGLPNYRSLHHFESELPRQYAFLQQMIKQGLPSLIITGTCFEYGMQSGPLTENTATHPSNPYGFAKDALRQQLEYLKQQVPFNFTWARLFYMYGTGQAKNSLLPQLEAAVAQGAAQFNMSGGEQLRDYLPVSAIARQLVMLALKQKDIGIINVCSGKPQSVRNLVEHWIQENHWKIRLNLGYYAYPDHEPMAFWGCRQKLDTLLGQ
ncbi:MAG: NAD(P)-dependent oxidoreductase [Methylococcaceae bacterium]|nr:MAG: NAD(P)-dependent oxidoreductase [Methylococcaceae bacterium]